MGVRIACTMLCLVLITADHSSALAQPPPLQLPPPLTGEADETEAQNVDSLIGPVVAKLLPSAIWLPDSGQISRNELIWGNLVEENP